MYNAKPSMASKSHEEAQMVKRDTAEYEFGMKAEQSKIYLKLEEL